LTKIDSLSYEITVTPDISETEEQWYAIYRSEDDILDVDNDIIIDIHFGNMPYTINEYFSGNQNFNGSYGYFATTLNRNWNESVISNSETTDLIPSFAPTVITSTPAENEEVDVTQSIEIEFSKSMNINSFTDLISITPEVQINSLVWSDENRTLSIDTDNLVYATSYTLVIDSTAEDVNGVQLDGDGNGIPGDSFILNFHTSVVDIFPPQVTFNNPNNNDLNVDIASIITVEFDEKVDGQTLTNNGIKLWNQYHSIDFSYIHTETPDGRSVVSIQPNNLLDISTTYKLTLGENISDILGNALGEEINIIFTTSRFSYEETTMIENFTSPGAWKQPGYSGSTTGIFESGTNFEYTDQIYLPATSSKQAGKLSYLWDENADAYLLREYLSGGTPQATYFDTNYVLQSYVFGDGSNNQYRFCIDEYQGSGWGDHEVSKWVTIDWHGWKLIEWQLNDPNSVGTWFCDEILTGSYFRIDSYQLTKSDAGEISGVVYFDDLRAVKKVYVPTGVDEINENIPDKFVLFQNYPNPFNPTTIIKYAIPSNVRRETQDVRLTVYDILGREVATLVNKIQEPGTYEVEFNGSSLSSGIYFYKLEVYAPGRAGQFSEIKKMLLMK